MNHNQVSDKEYDIAIVGTGPAGISLALRLIEQTSAKILLIESGQREVIPDIQELSLVEATGHFPGDYFSTHAQRLFGGTSNLWAGFCTTLEERSFLNHDWPIDYAEIRPYYKDAAAILELPDEAHQTPKKPLTNEGIVIYKPYFKSPPVRFGEKYYSA